MKKYLLLFVAVIAYCAATAQTTFNYTGSLQTYTVPVGVTSIHIDASGAQGGSINVSCSASGGLGARMQGDFTVAPGDIITILVGQQGLTNGADAGGGGGSFVVAAGNVPLLVAGGGGGASNNIGSCGSNLNGIDATITTSGTASGNGLVAGGTSGNGGGASGGSGGGGGGFYTDGTAGAGLANNNGKSYLNGGAGGTGNNNDFGGYGGGGAGWFTGGNGGGGGGYSGGGTSGSQPFTGGGGGGSYNIGTNQVNTAGFQTGNGIVIITPLIPAIDIEVSGNATAIANGDITPNTADFTDFGNIITCSGNISKTFKIKNYGSGSLSLTGGPIVSITGTNAADFTVTAVPTTPVLASDSTQFTISFDPGGNGIRTATITIANDDPDENPYTFSIQGTGNADVIAPILTCPGGSTIISSLSTSASLYSSAAQNTLVPITQAEFNNLQATLPGATFVGNNTFVPGNNYSAGPYIEIINQSLASIPPNKILVGFYVENAASGNDVAPRIASQGIGTDLNVEITFPTVNIATPGPAYFAIKDPNQSSPLTTYLGVYRTLEIQGDFSAGANLYNWESGDPALVTQQCNCGMPLIYGIYIDAVPTADIIAYATPGQCSAIVNFNATANDNCPSGTTITYSQNPGTAFSVGTTIVDVTATDGSGNSSMCSFNVIVNDTIDPVTPTISDAIGQCSITVTPPSTTDNCAGTIVGNTSDPLTYSTQGNYIITWIFDDNNGNLISVDQNVIIDDNTSPVADVASLTAITSCTPVTISTMPTATDNCDGAVSATTLDPLTYSAVGNYTVTFTYTDANGNTATQTQAVNIINCSGIESQNAVSMSIYPNPSNGTFTLSFTQTPIDGTEMNILNELGQVVETTLIQQQTGVYNYSHLKAGTYFIQIRNNEISLTKTMIISH